MSETYVTYKVWDGCKAPANLEYNGRLIGQIARESTIDRDALLALADEISDTSCDYHGELSVSLGDIWGWAQAIREACGEVVG